MWCHIQWCITWVWIGPSFLNSSIELLPKINVNMTKEEMGEGVWSRKKDKKKYPLSFAGCNHRKEDTAPLPTFESHGQILGGSKKYNKRLQERDGKGPDSFCFIAQNECRDLWFEEKQENKRSTTSRPDKIKKVCKTWFYSEKRLQMWCLGSKHYAQNYSYLPFITTSKLLISRALLSVSPEMQLEISE